MSPETLRQFVSPFLFAIKDKMTETYGLSIFDEKPLKSVVLETITGPDYMCFNIPPGTATPVYTSAPGKAVFAHLPEKKRQRLLTRLRLKKLTEHTLTTRKAFEAELERVRKQGYATDLSEEALGCHCGGVVILNPQKVPVAALWLSGIAERLPKPKLLSSLRILQETASLIEAKLSEQSRQQPTGTLYSACVRQALSLLDGHLRQPVSHSELARLCHVSYSTLRILFLRETGTTPGQYALVRRLSEAKRLLSQTDLPVATIADRIGCCTQKHFSAIFKRKFGVSPLAYRNGKQPRP